MNWTQEQVDAHQKRHGFSGPEGVKTSAEGPVAAFQAEVEVSPARNRWEKQEELKLHSLLIEDLRRRGWPYIHANPAKPSTIRRGFPDFTVLRAGRAACVEFKAPGGLLSADQRECLAELAAAGVPVLVTSDLGAAILFLRKHLEP